MKQRILLSVCMVLVFPWLCRAQSFNKRQPLVDVREIKEITIFAPYSQIEVVGKGMEQVHFDSASLVASKLNLELLYEKKDLFENVYFHSILDSSRMESYSRELVHLAEKASKNSPLEDLRIGPSLHALMEQAGTRYGLMVFHDGFVRKKGNMAGELMKSVALGVATMGNYTDVPASYQSNVFFFIIDKDSGHAVYAKKYEGVESHPLKKKSLAGQYKVLLKDFYD